MNLDRLPFVVGTARVEHFSGFAGDQHNGATLQAAQRYIHVGDPTTREVGPIVQCRAAADLR